MIRAVYLAKYPEGVPVEAVDRFYLDIHMREQRAVPGLRRFFSHRTLIDPEDPVMPGERYDRLIELWFDDIEAYRRARAEIPNYTLATWGNGKTWGKLASVLVDEVPEWNMLEMA